MIEEKEEKLRSQRKYCQFRRTSKQVHSTNKLNKEVKLYDDIKYIEQLRLATSEHRRRINNRNDGDNNNSYVVSICDIVEKHNSYLSPNASKLLTKSTVHRYFTKILTGISPIIIDSPPTILLVFEKVMALYCRMVQYSFGILFVLTFDE